MKIIPLKEEYVEQMVDVHMQSFPEFFLTFLGPRFLKEFYSSFLHDRAGMAFVAVEDGNVLGGVVGPLNPDGYFKRLLMRRWYAFILASLSAVIKKPSVMPRLFRAVFYRGDSPDNGQPRSLLSSIAVSPDSQGKGVGAALVNAWLEEAEKRESKGCFLTTDKENNESTNRFYKKLGWKLETSFATPEGRKMNRYVYDFDN
ncbi:MAG: GNAT family N-acetyltransferase [Sedimentisphaeraceae bacterium JB056]